MSLRNLEIVNTVNPLQKEAIEQCVNELESFITNNYNELNKEVAIEFNIGSKIQPYSMHLVIYNNPERKNNPYVFILAQLEEKRVLVNKAELAFFAGLTDYDNFRDLNITLRSGFKNLPKFAFLSEQEIKKARKLSKEYDER